MALPDNIVQFPLAIGWLEDSFASRKVVLFDTANGKRLATLDRLPGTIVGFSPDGRGVAVAVGNDLFLVFDLLSGKQLEKFNLEGFGARQVWPLDDGWNGAIAQNLRIEGTILIVKLEEYSIVYADIEEGVRRVKTSEDIINDAVDGLKADDPGVRVVRKDPITVSGFPARDIAFVHPEGGTYVCRIVVADSRLYMVTAGGPNMSDAGNERTRRFLESFEITDPQLVAKQKERRANQQLVEQGVKRARERMRRQNRIAD